MQAPDFAEIGPPALEHKDLLFLFEHFPVPGVDPATAAQRVIEQPSTLESLLESSYVYRAMSADQRAWLDISPKLYFNVTLRRALRGQRSRDERRTIHYLANLLSLFVRTERLYRVAGDEETSYEYLSDLVAAAAASDARRRFLIHAHIGNYGLFLAGVCQDWLEHRRRFKRRPLSLDYYRDMARAHYARVAGDRLSQDYGLKEVFAQLAGRFEYYRAGLAEVGHQRTH